MMTNKLLSFLYSQINNLLLILFFVVVVYILIFGNIFHKKDYKTSSIKVYVCGEVENPGVYELPLGARIQDALFLAKLKNTADLNSINLAKKLRDEDMIRIYPKKSNIKININTADADEISKLPGISKKVAQEIIKYREENGNFTNIKELLRIKSITLEDLQEISQYIEL